MSQRYGRKQPRHGVAALRVTVAWIGAVTLLAAVVVASTADSARADPLGFLVGRALIRTIHHDVQRDRAIGDINRERDSDLAEVAQEELLRTYQHDRKWLDDASYQQELARLAAVRTGIEERALRERQITNYDTRHLIRGDLADTFENALKAATGLDPQVVAFVGGIVRGERPLTAAIDALSAGGAGAPAPGLDKIRGLQEKLEQARTALKAVKDPKGPEAQALLGEALQRTSGLVAGGPSAPPTGVARELGQVREKVRQAQELLEQGKEAIDDLLPNDIRPNVERFAKDARWASVNAAIQGTDASPAQKAVLGGFARAAADRVDAILKSGGVTLAEEDIVLIAAEAGARYVSTRASAAGGAVDLDDVVRDAINEQLAVAGLDPLPEAGAPAAGAAPTPEVEEEVTAYVATGILRAVIPGAPADQSLLLITESTVIIRFPVGEGAVTGDIVMVFRFDQAAFDQSLSLALGGKGEYLGPCFTFDRIVLQLSGQTDPTGTLSGTALFQSAQEVRREGCERLELNRTFDTGETVSWTASHDGANRRLSGRVFEAEEEEFWFEIEATVAPVTE